MTEPSTPQLAQRPPPRGGRSTAPNQTASATSGSPQPRCKASSERDVVGGTGVVIGASGRASEAVEHVRHARMDDVALVLEAQLLHHARGRAVVGKGEGHEVVEAELLEAELHRGPAELRGEAFAPAVRAHRPAHLDLVALVDDGAAQAAAGD